jgi:uncharacterized protein DUF5996
LAHDVAAVDRWPALPLAEWRDTCATLHMWTQMVGKTRLALAPPQNHWWQVTLYLTARGLATGPMPHGSRTLDAEFDFVEHALVLRTGEGARQVITLRPRSVAEFYRIYLAALETLGVHISLWPVPVEIEHPIRFPDDTTHASYDPEYANRFWRILVQADDVLRRFRAPFIGKCSPVHFFWGSFDLAVTRFSGRPAPRHPGGAPNCAAWVMEEAYSREVSSAGWWPRSEAPGPSFYSYTYPQPDGYPNAPVRPAGAFFDSRMGEFMLPYDEVRRAADPDAAVLDFLESTYEAGANLGRWDRATLEPAVRPERPLRRPWSTVPTGR